MAWKIFVPVLRWLGYTRRERRASVILLVLIISVILLKHLIHPVRQEIKELAFAPLEKTAADSGPVMKVYERRARERIELNKADSAELVTLPGIGPVLAGRIIRFRRILGGFVNIYQLKEVYGLKEETFNLISDRITADSTMIILINVNSTGYRDLLRHPYLDHPDVQKIIKYRELKGKITGFRDIYSNNLIDSLRINKIRPYLVYE